MRPPPCAPPIMDIAGHAPIEHRRLQGTLRETRWWRGLFLNPRHHGVDTKADAHRPCSVIVNPEISASRLPCFRAHCGVYPPWLLAELRFVRHGRLHSASMYEFMTGFAQVSLLKVERGVLELGRDD